jgi:ADP-ribose pyrophosphatase YjhB (NUDIX family)
LTNDLLALLDEIRAIGQLGLNYSTDPYDRDRYERLLRLAAREYAEISGLPEADLDAYFRRELGYITPKTGCNGAIFNEQGHALLVKRSDDGRWGMPGGYAEVNATPRENCRREVWEETGLEVEVGELVDVFCVLPGDYGQPNTNYIMVYLCVVTGGTLTPSHETPVVGYYDHTTVTDWHMSHGERVARAYEKWRSINEG